MIQSFYKNYELYPYNTQGSQLMNKYNIEESLLKAMDALEEQAEDKATKILASLFKAALLKKYQDALDVELPTGKVHKENVDKAFEFRFSDACAAIRTLPGVSDDEKEGFLKEAKLQKTRIKEVVYDILASNNIEIVE